MKALVTGATGFVGSRLSKRLVMDGHSVSILVRKNSNRRELANILERILVCEIDRTAESVDAHVAAIRPDVIFHVATYFSYEPSPHEINALVDGNILFPLQLINSAARHGVRNFVNTGSVWQHFRDADYDPVCLHAATKQAFETLLAYYVNVDKLRCVTLKLSDTYGPGDPRKKIFALLQKHAASGEPLLMSPGEQLIDPTHVDDAVSAFLIAADRLLSGAGKAPHEQYVVSSGKSLSLRQMVDMYARATGLSFPINWGARPYRPREVMAPWSHGKTLPGWSPRVSLEEGLKELAGTM